MGLVGFHINQKIAPDAKRIVEDYVTIPSIILRGELVSELRFLNSYSSSLQHFGQKFEVIGI